MIRTSISFLLLFGCLLVVSKALEQSQAQDRLIARGSRLATQRMLARRAHRAPRMPLTEPMARDVAPRELASDPPAAPLPQMTIADEQLVSTAEIAVSGVDSPLPPILLAAPEVDREHDVVRTGAEAATGPQLIGSPAADAADETAAPAGEQRVAEGRTKTKPRPVITSVLRHADRPAKNAEPPASDAAAEEMPTLQFPAFPQMESLEAEDLTENSASENTESENTESENTESENTESENADSENAELAAEPASQAEAATEREVLLLDEVPPAVSSGSRPAREDAVTVDAPQEVPGASSGDEEAAELDSLRESVRDVLAHYLERPEQVERRAPWGVMHAFIAFGVDTEVLSGGRRANAIAYLCWNGPCRGQRLLGTDRQGRLEAHQGIGVQGHAGQFLAMLAQSKVKSDYPLRVDGRDFTVADLIRYEQDTCKEKTELTFKLIGLVHYLDPEATWKSRDGKSWDLPKLIKEELAQPVIGSACGGTHRMMGFSYAVRKREKTGGTMDGQWLRAKKYVDSYHDYTFSLQNADGSFSTNWFRGPGALGDDKRRLETTGHTLEWLVYSLPQEELTQPRVVKSVEFLAKLLWDHREQELEVGPKGHALHALALYDERVFGGQPGQRRVELARQPTGEAR